MTIESNWPSRLGSVVSQGYDPALKSNWPGLWGTVIWNGCDPAFSRGLEKFRDALFQPNGHTSYSLGGKKFSVRSLIATHLDKPYDRFLNTHFPNNPSKIVIQTKLSDYLVIEGKREDLSQFDNISYSLLSWALLLKEFYKDNEESMRKSESFIMISATFDSVIELLRLLGWLRPQSINIKSDQDDTAVTTKVHKNYNKYCLLCWRRTRRAKYHKQGIHYQARNFSDKYCDIHQPSISQANLSNYIRDRKTRHLFEYELENFINPELTKFCRSPKSLLTKPQRSDEQIRRKVVYDLSRSGLNRDEIKETHRLGLQGLTVGEIAKEMNIKHQTVSKRLKTIVRKVHSITQNASFSSDTGELIGHWADESTE